MTCAAVLYCSTATRKWTNNLKEDHILFVLCSPNTAKPLMWRSSEKPKCDETEQLRPLPFVKGQIVNSPKMTSYEWSQIREFVQMIEFRPEFGEGQWAADKGQPQVPSGRPPAVPSARPPGVAPGGAPPAVPSARPPAVPPGKPPGSSTSPPARGQPPVPGGSSTSPPVRAQPPPPGLPTRALPQQAPDEDRPTSARSKKNNQDDEDRPTSARGTKKTKSIKSPRKAEPEPELVPTIPAPTGRKPSVQVLPTYQDPTLDALTLSDASFAFMNEGDVVENTQSGSVTSRGRNAPRMLSPRSGINKQEAALIGDMEKSLSALQDLVSQFDDPTTDHSDSPFTQIGLASYFGMRTEFEDEKFKPPKIERKKPPPVIGAPPGKRPAPSQPPPGLPPPRVPPSGPPASLPPALPPGTLGDVLWEGHTKLHKADWQELIGKSNNGALGTNIVNFFMGAQNQVAKGKKPSIHCLSSEFYPTMIKDPTKLFGYIEENDVVGYDRVFIPIHESSHWAVVMVNLEEHHMEYYDALGQKGDDVAKHIQKFFKEVSKFAKKDSRSRKTVTHKKVDNLKLVPESNAALQSNPTDSGVIMLYHLISLIDHKTIVMGTDGRSKVALKLLELLQQIKPLDANVLRELGIQADQASPIEILEDKAKKSKGKSKDVRKTLAPGAIQGVTPESPEGGRKRKGSH